MNFYYINDNNTAILINESSKKLCQTIRDYVQQEKSHYGVIGAIDNAGRLRASKIMYKYDRKIMTVISLFVRKYAAIAVLEKLAAEIQEANTLKGK